MGYHEMFVYFNIIKWSHGEEQTWFGSSINSVMTANGMGFSSGFLPQCLKLQQPNPKTWHGLAQMVYQELFAHSDIM